MLYVKLTDKARSYCDVIGVKSDKEIKKKLVELRVCLRLDYNISHSVYIKMNNSQIIERYIEESSKEKFYGS